MENPLNIQNTFFNQARKDRAKVTVYLTSGIKLVGRIKSFDKFTVILESSNGEQMIFKHAVSTVSAIRSFGNYVHMDRERAAEARSKGGEAEPGPEAPAAEAAAPGAGTK